MEATEASPATRHLGLDLGGTYIKWAVVEHDGAGWRLLDRDQLATPAAQGAAAVVSRLAAVGADAIDRAGPVRSIGIGIPGRYDASTGATRFLVNVPGDWDAMPVAAPVGGALGLPTALINDARAFGLAELR
ncbi:MAG: ROK family protein, partial [Chloroflexota bacterium]